MINTKETQCESCIHKNVCGKKSEYKDVLTELNEILVNKNADFTISVECTHYNEGVNLRQVSTAYAQHEFN